MTRRVKSDEGAVLIIALVVVTVVALVTGALLTKGTGNLLSSVQLRQVSASAYSADAAAKFAINNLEIGGSNTADVGAWYPDSDWVYNNADDGTGCFGRDSSETGAARSKLQLNNFYPAAGKQTGATSARVECSLVQGSGVFGSGQGVEVNDQNGGSGNAVITLGTSGAEDGIYTKPLGDNALKIHGDVASKSNVNADGNGIETSGALTAVQDCNGTIISTPPKVCPGGAPPDDPNYPSGLGSAGVYRDAAALPCVSGVRTFPAGYYDDADALSTATSGSCIAWFPFGDYYFDFRATPETKWTISGTVIGGTPLSPSNQVISAPVPGAVSANFPGNCVTPLDSRSTASSGVKFVFGGESHLELGNDAQVEICASRATATTPPIGFYGLKSDGPAPTPESVPDLSASASPAPAYTGFVNANADSLLAQMDGGAPSLAGATWANVGGTNGSPHSASITLTGFAPAPSDAIPVGSILTSAVLTVRHQEPSGVGRPPKITVTLPAGGSALATPTLSSPQNAAWNTDTITLTSALAQRIHDGTFTGLKVKLDENMAGTGNAFVDFVTLDITYTSGAVRGQSGCVTAVGGCAVMFTPNPSFHGDFFIHGATYVPGGRVDLSLGNGAVSVLGYGLVARSLSVREVGSFSYDGPVITLPDIGPGLGTNVTAVDLKVFICPGKPTCAGTAGVLALTTRVKVTDPVNSLPDPNKRKMEILSWSEQR